VFLSLLLGSLLHLLSHFSDLDGSCSVEYEAYKYEIKIRKMLNDSYLVILLEDMMHFDLLSRYPVCLKPCYYGYS
jgi:hypothetical protein